MGPTLTFLLFCAFRASIGAISGQVPTDLLGSFVSSLASTLSEARLLHSHVQLPTQQVWPLEEAFSATYFTAAIYAAPRSALARSSSTLPLGLRKIDFRQCFMGDEVIAALSASGAAPSLTQLTLGHNILSDSSGDCWAKFVALEQLNVGHAYQIGPRSIEAIGLQPTIRSFAVKAHPMIGRDAFLNLLISPSLFPHLETLTLENVFLHDLQLLKAKSSLRLIEHVRTDISISDLVKNMDVVSRLRSLPCTRFPFKEHPEMLPNLRNLRSLSFEHAKEGDLDDIDFAVHFPVLEEFFSCVRTNIDPACASQLRNLTSLKSLAFRSTFQQFPQLPPHLRWLSVNVVGEPTTSLVTQFVDNLCGLSASLVYCFGVFESSSTFNTSDLDRLLATMDRLERVHLDLFKPPAQPFPQYYVSHPTISSASFLAAGVSAVPRYLPAVHLSGLNDKYRDYVSASSTPNVMCVEVSYNDPSIVGVLSKLDQRKLHSFLIYRSLFTDELDALTSLTFLRNLHLSHVETTDDDMERIFTSLPLLCCADLDLDLKSPTGDFYWLEHRFLRSLRLRTRSIGEEFSSLTLNEDMTPMLVCLALNGVAVKSLHISGLPDFAHADLKIDCDEVSICDCPVLAWVSFDNATLQTVKLRPLPALNFLNLYCTTVPAEDSSFDLDLPGLKRLEVHGADFHRCERVGEIIKKKLGEVELVESFCEDDFFL